MWQQYAVPIRLEQARNNRLGPSLLSQPEKRIPGNAAHVDCSLETDGKSCLTMLTPPGEEEKCKLVFLRQNNTGDSSNYSMRGRAYEEGKRYDGIVICPDIWEVSLDGFDLLLCWTVVCQGQYQLSDASTYFCYLFSLSARHVNVSLTFRDVQELSEFFRCFTNCMLWGESLVPSLVVSE
ncbi:hypothetical protein RRG08_033541 [Elysia crispata]|uniref:Uncharacterized protein n=1 Tax=Elysia crispata TaxID=231223 RepID=A0AAE0XPE2_9GAST|nr:hypothetical protein RRG08_033541 [Elysia crispata]